MLKMLDKTNIDFIGPRYYCMAGSVILIVLGLIATGVRWQGMFNIDFTGGTLVTIRLNENDPSVKTLSESQRAELVRKKASVLPDVTVESLRMGERQASWRGSTSAPPTKTRSESRSEILEAFGPSLARVEMTYSARASRSPPRPRAGGRGRQDGTGR